MTVAPYTVEPRPDTGVNNVMLGTWLFLASEVMLFGGLFSAYVLLRAGAPEWPRGFDALNPGQGVLYLVVLTAATLCGLRAARAAARGATARARSLLGGAAVLGGLFLSLKALGYWDLFSAGIYPATSTYFATYFLLTAVHAAHVLGGTVVSAYLGLRGTRNTGDDGWLFANRLAATGLYWMFVELVWIVMFVLLYTT